jgi:hypothetical protein
MFKISDDKIECADQHQEPRSRCQHQEIRILKADALVKDLRLLREDLLKGCVNSDANVSLTKVCLGSTLKTGPSFSEELKTPASQGFSKP